MTLDTKVAIGGPIDPDELFGFCRALLETPDDVPIERHVDGSWGRASVGHPPGVGLDAWLIVYYGPGGQPLRHTCQSYCDEDCTDQADGRPDDTGWAYAIVSFDTAYGYRNERGESCSALHARLAAVLGAWLDERGLPWKWQNEYTGEWFDGRDQLAEFAGAHTAPGGADEWFRTMVLPAILATTLDGGEPR